VSKRGHGPREQQELRLVVESHDLDDADRSCTACGGSLEEMGQAEESEEIDVIAREFVRKKHVRKKYRCRCGACIETAPMPARLVPGGRYSLAFAISVAISKYADHRVPRMRIRRLRAKGGAMLQS
jgi:transposase